MLRTFLWYDGHLSYIVRFSTLVRNAFLTGRCRVFRFVSATFVQPHYPPYSRKILLITAPDVTHLFIYLFICLFRSKGDWFKDVRHGRGVLTSGARDFLYDGDWLMDKRTGNGNCVIKGRETYSGQWKDGEFHGRGVHCDARGDVYDGEVCAFPCASF